MLNVTDVPNNVRATVLTPRSVRITWNPSSSLSNVTAYLITYTTSASYTSDGNLTVNGTDTASGTLTDLEENTLYDISVQSISVNGIISSESNEVSVTTYTDGMYIMHVIIKYHVLNSTVPSSPPQNVMVTSLLPGVFNISWDPPPEIDQNGLLFGYIIHYVMIEFGYTVGSGDIYNETFVFGVNYTLTGLFTFVNYSIQVGAVTINGSGPFSAPVIDIPRHKSKYPKKDVRKMA